MNILLSVHSDEDAQTPEEFLLPVIEQLVAPQDGIAKCSLPRWYIQRPTR